jgi:hypothetical protein
MSTPTPPPKTAVETDARMIGRLRILMDQKESLEEQVKETTEQIKKVKLRLRSSFQTQEIKSLNIEGLGTCGTRDMIYAKVEDPDAAREWLAEIGREEVLTEQFNKSRLNSLVKERLENGDGIPECVSWVESTEVSLRRS